MDNADIEASAGELEGVETFQACSWLARMRTFQGRLDEITELLLKARALIEVAQPTEENALDAMAHALMERDLMLFLGIPPSAPPKPQWARVAHKRWQSHWDWSLSLDGAELAALGEYEDARAVCEEWVYLNQKRVEVHTGWHFASALCSANLGDMDEAQASLEKASLAHQYGPSLWFRAKWASKLAAGFRYVDLSDEAEEWEVYLDRAACPTPTKVALRERALRVTAQPCYVFG